jgi:uncharacterized protein (TIGR03067 family)
MTPLVLGLALAVAAPASKKPDEPPPGKLEGGWVVQSFDGPKDGPPPGSITFHFADGKISVTDPGRNGKPEEVEYTADMTKKPATINIRPRAGGPGGAPDKLVLGIVEVKGDTMRL